MSHYDHVFSQVLDMNCDRCRSDFVLLLTKSSLKDFILDAVAESLPDRSLKMGEYDGTSTS